jgi:iron complex transport system ATP-binding protein
MNECLSVRDLSFSYARRSVLEGLSFNVRPGDAVAIVGANGAGKTTLLKILCGLLAPTLGEVLFQKRALKHYRTRELARLIALVPQEIQVTFDFTVLQFVEQGRTPHISSFLGALQRKDHKAVLAAMEMADVSHMAERRFSQLSGGERQRVKIALALAQEPQVLLLDEPVQQLDIGRQDEVFAVLRRLNRCGVTIIAAVHDLYSIHTHFSSALLLGPGASFCYGPSASVLTPGELLKVFGRHIPAAWLSGLPSTNPDVLETELR